MRTAEDVIRFWFTEHGPDDWFGGKPEFDAAIAARFGKIHAYVSRGEGWAWRQTAEGRLAEVIVLDQFSRQLFRNDGKAFAQDSMALVLAQEAIAAGADQAVDAVKRAFFYLPFMHAEALVIQDEGMRLYQALGDAAQLDFMTKHREAIARFGRFPFRNAALGRTSTPDELAYMAEAGGRSF